MRATECWLPRSELVLLRLSYVALVACESPKHPFRVAGHLAHSSGDDVQPPDIGKGISNDRVDADNPPCTGRAAYERIQSGIHLARYLLFRA